MAGWQEHHTKTRARETPAQRVINDLVDPCRCLTGHMYAHKKAAMIQDGTITRKMLDDAKKSKRRKSSRTFTGRVGRSN